MKFQKGQRVTIPTWVGAVGEIVHAFIVTRFAQPDAQHYNVRVGEHIFEYSEDELA